MAGQDLGFIRQLKQAGLNRVDDLIKVAAWQIGTTDAAGKKSVAGNEQFEGHKMEADRTLGVARGVQHLGGVVFQANDGAVCQAPVGRRGLGSGNADPRGLRFHQFEERQVIFVEKDGCTGKLL